MKNKMDKSGIVERFKNFSEVFNYWAEKTPKKIFIKDISADKNYNYSDFNKLVNSVVRLLKNENVKSGDIISVCIRNSSEFLLIYFASIRLGGIVNPFPFSTSQEEMIKNLNFIKSKIVFLEEINSEKVSKKFKTFTVRFNGRNSFIDIVKKFSSNDVKEKIDENKPACLYYSSGTTANPKGILYSHKNMVSLIGSICRCFGHTFDTIHFGFLPMGHTAITNYSFLPTAYAGGTLIFSENFMKIRKDFWRIIQKYRVSYVETVPTVIFSLLNTEYPNYSREKISLKYVGCGSAPLPVSVQNDFQKKFGLPLANLYGLSETGPTHFDDPLKKGWKSGSIGFPIDVNECKIFDDNFKELSPNKIGEIAIKGKNVFIGYYKNEKAYKGVVKKDFFLTGDLGYKDKNNKFFYVDRKKDLIIKGGSNIFPGEIDEILFKHPSVLEVSTIGVPDKFSGEEIISFVVLKSFATEEELIKHCARHLQYFKCPKKIIFLQSMPKTYSGKLLRKELRLIYNEKYV